MDPELGGGVRRGGRGARPGRTRERRGTGRRTHPAGGGRAGPAGGPGPMVPARRGRGVRGRVTVPPPAQPGRTRRGRRVTPAVESRRVAQLPAEPWAALPPIK